MNIVICLEVILVVLILLFSSKSGITYSFLGESFNNMKQKNILRSRNVNKSMKDRLQKSVDAYNIYKNKDGYQAVPHPVKVSWMQMQRLTEQRSRQFVEIFMKKMTAMYLQTVWQRCQIHYCSLDRRRWKFFCWQGWKF